ncbi:hypothetical protein CCY99_07490 [Helicobacter sp. 16-1353]|uniref:DUF3343 domain-containing protein n=1 Tax=Helicobacter sp. 16-1353 TaxID=2004996 RepID=UPI000DCCBDD8|nr:DUF3343 domain-containing protein [Helicobacter sp. 16-1353]RAX52480.1 hypothetical protein CCY99_07490 [Helicobacter sp. 16-1353]
MKGYILVWTTFSAFECERILGGLEWIYIRLVPTPREFSSDCGIAVFFEIIDEMKGITTIENILKDNKIEYEIKILN